jgi:hypothetical protein
MHIALRSFIRLHRISQIAIVPVFAAVSVLALSAAGQQTPLPQAQGATAAPASQVSANESGQASCPSDLNRDIPISTTIEAKVTGILDSGHLKVGNKIWVIVLYGISYPGCRLNAGSALYGHVTAAISQKNPNFSELSLVFDHADCEGHAKKEMPLWVVGLMGPPDVSERMHDEVPTVMQGASRSTVAAVLTASGGDDKLNPGGPANTVHPGIVIGKPKVKLEPQGGPGCSARITSTNRSVQLETGSELILIAPSTP